MRKTGLPARGGSAFSGLSVAYAFFTRIFMVRVNALGICCLLFAQANAQSAHVDQKNTFTSELLNAKELEAFEKRAKQKLEDFYNFLSVVTNPEYDMKLRKDAKQQALELFSGKDCVVDGITIEKLLDSCLNITYRKYGPVMGKITVVKKFPATPDLIGYSGMLDFMLYTASSEAVTKHATMMLIKTEKLFGTERKQVWTVYLCGIN